MNTINYTITTNARFNSREILFSCKPSEAVRDALKAIGFRWNRARGIWYGYSTEDEIRAAIEGKGTTETQERTSTPKKAQKTTGTPQDTIRIYYNGIKVNGKLVRCYYSLNNDRRYYSEDCVSISAKDYENLPRDLLPVTNDTDVYTDYFDSDRATITAAHPLYKYFRYASMKAQARMDRPYCEKLRATLNSGKREPWPGHYDHLRDDLARREAFLAEFDKEVDPGQPTAEDLAEIDRQRQEAENARRAAEHEEELKRREKALAQRVNGQRLIKAEMEAHPIDAQQPVVLIHWSEHPAFCEYEDDSLLLSLTAADNILRTFDDECKDDLGYFKTKFTITGGEFEGEPIDYTGRYDLGDNEGGLIQHIRNFGEWNRTHNIYGHEIENPEESTATTRFADFLDSFVA